MFGQSSRAGEADWPLTDELLSAGEGRRKPGRAPRCWPGPLLSGRHKVQSRLPRESLRFASQWRAASDWGWLRPSVSCRHSRGLSRSGCCFRRRSLLVGLAGTARRFVCAASAPVAPWSVRLPGLSAFEERPVMFRQVVPDVLGSESDSRKAVGTDRCKPYRSARRRSAAGGRLGPPLSERAHGGSLGAHPTVPSVEPGSDG